MKRIYCVNCGKVNKAGNKVCKYCGNELSQKDHELIDFIKDKVKDELSGGIQDNFFNYVYAFLKKYLYGIAVSLSIVVSASMVIVNQQKEVVPYKIVQEVPNFKESSIVSWLEGCWSGNRADSSVWSLKTYRSNMDKSKIDDWFVVANDEKRVALFLNNFYYGSGNWATFERKRDDSFVYSDGTPVASTATFYRTSCDSDREIYSFVIIKEDEMPSSLPSL